jgi:hypothetical protein
MSAMWQARRRKEKASRLHTEQSTYCIFTVSGSAKLEASQNASAPHAFNIVLDLLANAIRQEKENI